MKLRDQLTERRRYLRLQTPIKVTYTVPENGRSYSTLTKNISADGLRFETSDKDMKEASQIDIILVMPDHGETVKGKAAVIWKKKISLEDAAPYDVGLELREISESDKNAFLKFLCDLLYRLSKEHE